jgi:serine/threonine protein kinase
VDVAIREPIAGRYQLREKLGGGGMAEVYDAVDLRLDRPVAVKLLRDGLLETPGMVERAEAEARLAARIHHPNVVGILDAGRTDDTPFVVMERLPGLTLREHLAHAPLDDTELRSIGTQILSGLAAAHELGVIHRDIKPSNILAGPRGTWKIADFGIATWLAGETTLTATGEIVGSAPYLAPERAEGRSATPASDLYSVGVLLYEAATGRRPVERDDPVATVMAIREGAREPLSTHRPNLDRALRVAIERALVHDPVQRWPSAAAFAAALERAAYDVATERAIRLADAEPAPTEPLAPPVPHGSGAGDEPSTQQMPAGDSTNEATPDDGPGSAAPIRERRSLGRHAARPRSRSGSHASRVLGIALAAAIAIVVLFVVATFALVEDDAPSRRTLPTVDATVPDDLRASMDQLREAISP